MRAAVKTRTICGLHMCILHRQLDGAGSSLVGISSGHSRCLADFDLGKIAVAVILGNSTGFALLV